jgi:hypothetical protein
MSACRVGIAGPGVCNQNGVAPVAVQTAVGLIGKGQRAEQAAAFQLQFDIEVNIFSFDNSGFSHLLFLPREMKNPFPKINEKGPTDTFSTSILGSVLISPVYAKASTGWI